LRQTRRNLVIGVDVIGKAVRQDDWPSRRRTFIDQMAAEPD